MLFNESLTWLLRLVLAHLLTDFVLQPGSWVRDRQARHFASPWLYAHGAVTAVGAWLLAGTQWWGTALFIGVTHTLIDGWKSYRSDSWKYFVIDQLLHLAVLGGCWWWQTGAPVSLSGLENLYQDRWFWVLLTGAVVQTMPASILIAQVTRSWRLQLPGSDQESLAHAGKYIGMIERVLIFFLVLKGQYAVVGFVIALKGLLRFGDGKRPEVKTEYLLIGTLMSIGIALISGLLAAFLLQH